MSPSFPPDHVQSAWFWGSGSVAFTMSSLPWKTQSRDGASVLPVWASYCGPSQSFDLEVRRWAHSLPTGVRCYPTIVNASYGRHIAT